MKIVYAFALIMLALGSCDKVHVYTEDPPIEQGHYLTYIHIEKIVPGDTAYEWRWEVLEFNPNMTKLPKWNTLHLDDWNVTVSHWTELPETPNGEKMQRTSGVLAYKTIELYEGYIHPSGDYKWTSKGWLALRPFFRLSEDSTRLIQIK